MRWVCCLLLVLLCSCAHGPVASRVIGNQSIEDEIARVGSLTAASNVSVGDFSSLGVMLSSDAYASHELYLTEVLVNESEYSHAGHLLGFLSGYVNSGQPILCPGHAVLHYYVFMSHGDVADASEQLGEAKSTLSAWVPLARSYNAEYPSGTDFGTILSHIQGDIGSIDAGNTTASAGELSFLNAAGSLCVEADSNANS